MKMRTTALLLPLLGLATSNALACGGFFCNNIPIEQSQEKIAFAIDEEEGTVEAHVQIFYQGEAEDFAWIVPISKEPEVGVSTDSLFSALDAVTQPSFQLEFQELGNCNSLDFRTGVVSMAAESFDDGDGAVMEPEDPVSVIKSGQVGAYDMVVLQATSSEALLEWLGDPDGDPATDDAFDLPREIGEVLDPYIANEAYFLALKLQSDRSTGDITPIKFTYPGDSASIPLVLTSIATQPDMRVQPFVFSNRRAVPQNYLHVEINEAAVDWLSGGGNYNDVVTMAANEAGGQAFATDYAGPTEALRGTIYTEDLYDLNPLRSYSNPIDFMNGLINRGLPPNAQLLGLLERFIPMPADVAAQGVTAQEFYNCLSCYINGSDIDFDADAFVDALTEEFIAPLKEAEEIFAEYDYVTRLTSSFSAEEMTVDPVFTLNEELPEVSNIHQATLFTDCRRVNNSSKAPRFIELQDGRLILVPSQEDYFEELVGDVEANDSNEPFFFSNQLNQTGSQGIFNTGAVGQPELVLSNEAKNAQALDIHNSQMRSKYRYGSLTNFKSGGCSTTGTLGGTFTLSLFGLLAFRRRRQS